MFFFPPVNIKKKLFSLMLFSNFNAEELPERFLLISEENIFSLETKPGDHPGIPLAVAGPIT